jgi:GldM C-terminal domain
MKIKLLIIFTYLMTTKIYSQEMAIAVEKMNVLYLGIDNPISIAMENTSCQDLIIKIANGKLIGNNCKYLVRCDSVGICRIQVYSKKMIKKNHSWLNEFRVKMIPKPTFKIGPYGNFNSSASKKVIQSQEYIRATLDNFDFDLSYSVDSFRVRIIRDTIEKFNFTNKGNKLNTDVRNAFLEIIKGDVIIFDKLNANSTSISSSLYDYYNATKYDNSGNPISRKNNNDKYLKLELEQFTLTVYD